MRTTLRITGRILRAAAIVTTFAAAAFLVVPRLLGWEVVTVLTGSMAPTYPADTALAVRPVDPREVRAGDVIAFVAADDLPLVTHRVVAVDHGGGQLSFVTKGDANDDVDTETVPASAVRGRVVAGVPHLGTFVRAVHHPMGFALFLVLPAVALMAQELGTMRRLMRAPPVSAPATDVGDDGTAFDFWTTITDEAHYYAALDQEIAAWRASTG